MLGDTSDEQYFETFNRPNVHLVDVKDTPIDEITPTGLRVATRLISVADGFDAPIADFADYAK